MKKLFLLLVAVFTVGLLASAQTRTVSGTVTNASDGEPLIGVSVMPFGESRGVLTDVEGRFTIPVYANVKKLTFAYVGMHPKDVAIPASGEMKVQLEPNNTVLSDVMVVAYGTVKKAEYTGSAAVVGGAELEDVLVSNVTNALSGKMAGVQTLNSNGQPGTGSSVLIRGVGSINASTSPLYVVDGMPFEGSISNLATSDIESMTVLKDAASTSLYGARGANGVIIITTKKGQEGQAKVTADMRWGGNSRALPTYDIIRSPEQYMETLYHSMYMSATQDMGMSADQAYVYANSNIVSALGQQTFTVPNGQSLIGRDGKFNPNATWGYSDGNYYYTPDDWYKGTFINGLRQEYNLSITGGTQRFNYYVSGSYLGDEGIIKGSHFNRFSTRTTMDYQAYKWLKVGTSMNYVWSNSAYPSSQTTTNSSSNAFAVVYQLAPVFPIYIRDAEGNIMYDQYYNRPIYDYGLTADYGHGIVAQRSSGAWGTANPAGDLAYENREFMSDILDSKWYAIITPLEGLTVSATAGYYINNERYHNATNALYGQSAAYHGSASQQAAHYRSTNLQGLASYSRTFNNVHNAYVMVGVESQDYAEEYVYGEGMNLYMPGNWALSNTIDGKTSDGASASLSHRSVFTNLKYNYNNRYFAQASWRRDASSRFAPEHRWGSFWSVSAGWNISEENFLKEQTWIDLLKIKASFGQNGNDGIGSSTTYIAYTDFYGISGADGVWSDSTPAAKGNRDITWEKSNNFNAGVDFAFFNGHLDGTIEYYSRQTSDMLMYMPMPPTLGWGTLGMPVNAGSMRNNGVEISANYRIFDTKDFRWEIWANATFQKNKIIKLDENLLNNEGFWEYSSSRAMIEGESMYNMYIVKYAGVDPETGAALYWAKRDKLDENGAPIPVLDANGNQAYKTNYKGEIIYTTDENGQLVPIPLYEQEEYKTNVWSDAQSTNRQTTGNLMPKVYGGFGTNFAFKGIDFSISFAYQAGGRIYDNAYAAYMDPGLTSYLGKTWHKDILNSWTPTNTNTDVPRMGNNSAYVNDATKTSDRFLISSNYLSLTNISVGYTFPKKWTKKLYMSSLRIYGAAENVALWSKRKGLDPRQGFIGSNNAIYSPIRSISGGVRVEF